LLLAVNGCGAHIMPAPQVPEKKVPEVAMPAEPPEEDEGQIVVDTTNGPATVQVQLLGMWTHPLCAATPCAANLPIGTYNLIFKGRNDPALESTEIVQVGRAPSVLRHTMGSARYSSGMYTGGILAVAAGLSLVFVGLLSAGSSDNSALSGGKGYAAIGIGAAATGLGAWMMMSGRPEITPGSSVQWAPGGAPPPAPASTKADKKQVLRLTPTGIAVSFK
jgi:hypothetical protein